jgi:hypothetical protein
MSQWDLLVYRNSSGTLHSQKGLCNKSGRLHESVSIVIEEIK